jgi:Uma2 family endonuclease
MKKALYERFGVAEFWIVNPYMKGIEVLALNAEGLYELFSEGCLMADGKESVSSKVLSGLGVDLTEVFTESFTDE